MPPNPDRRWDGDDAREPRTSNLEHYLWKNYLGFLIHPKVEIRAKPGQLRIAEVGTRTGIWLIDLAKKLGPSVQLDGFDYDLSLAPPIDWLPKNVALYKSANFNWIEDKFLGSYDVVRVGNIANHVFDNDPGSLMEKFIAMLKPGGYLQWNQPDTAHRRILKLNPGDPTPKTSALLAYVNEQEDGIIGPHTWISDLPDTFVRYGLEVPVYQHRFKIPNAYAQAAHDVGWLAMENHSCDVDCLEGFEGKGVEIRRMMEGALVECLRMGNCVVCDMVVVVGKKGA
ncbi:MAG: hypothetical protein Q9218_007882 [Villophora microphyllina]